MRIPLRQGVIVLMFALGLGCDGSSRPGVSPSPTPPPTPQPSGLTVNGWVGDTAFKPLGGTRIEVLDGPQAGVSALSRYDGSFSLTGTFDANTRFSAGLDGYVGVTQTWVQCSTCVNPYLTFTLGLTTPPVEIAGEYTVTFVADSACTAIPAELHTRSYTATMEPIASPSIPAGTRFLLRLRDGAFLPDYDYIFVGVAGDRVNMVFGGHGPSVADQVAPNTYIAYDGAVEVAATAPVQTLSGSFSGVVSHCALKAPMGSAYYSCPTVGPNVIAQSDCQSTNHRLVVTRR